MKKLNYLCYENLEIKTLHTEINHIQSLHISMGFSTVTIVTLKLRNFTLDFMLLLSNISLCTYLSPNQKKFYGRVRTRKTISFMSSFIIIILIILEFTKLSLHMISVCSCTLTAVPRASSLDTTLTT